VATGAYGWHWPVAIAATLLIVALGFDLRRLGNSSFLAAATTLVLVNVGYFVVYLLTPLDLRWQLMFSIERLVFHTMPLAIFVAFLAIASWARDPASVERP
jgi:bacteriorhodopsin